MEDYVRLVHREEEHLVRVAKVGLVFCLFCLLVCSEHFDRHQMMKPLGPQLYERAMQSPQYLLRRERRAIRMV